MSHDHDGRRQPSTWWVGRGQRPRRWWSDGATILVIATWVAWTVSFDPSERGWSLVAAEYALGAGFLARGHAAEHGVSSSMVWTCAGAVLAYVVAAVAAVVVLDLDTFSAATLAAPVVFAGAWLGLARMRQR